MPHLALTVPLRNGPPVENSTTLLVWSVLLLIILFALLRFSGLGRVIQRMGRSVSRCLQQVFPFAISPPVSQREVSGKIRKLQSELVKLTGQLDSVDSPEWMADFTHFSGSIDRLADEVENLDGSAQ